MSLLYSRHYFYAGYPEGSSGISKVPLHDMTAQRCSPHSLCSGFSHHQRPARMSSPGSTARVQAAQPMLGQFFLCKALTGTLLVSI